jgi:hypothetical protein
MNRAEADMLRDCHKKIDYIYEWIQEVMSVGGKELRGGDLQGVPGVIPERIYGFERGFDKDEEEVGEDVGEVQGRD